MKLILLDDESKEILEDKLSKIVSNIDNISNQKMLDIKNNLKMSFFID